MTRADRWRKRKCVVAYYAFKDACHEMGMTIPVPCRLTFGIPMPKSWSEKKKNAMAGQPHTQKPDVDNITKAVLDAVFEDDSHVWNVHSVKLWSFKPFISVEGI